MDKRGRLEVALGPLHRQRLEAILVASGLSGAEFFRRAIDNEAEQWGLDRATIEELEEFLEARR